MEIIDLNKKFGIGDKINFYPGKGGWAYVRLESEQATAHVSLYGAHVLNYVPKGDVDVLWNTDKSYFEAGKPIRGGIPVCWPWFGPHATDASKPMHGFARLSFWNVTKSQVTSGGETEIILSLTDSQETRSLWPYSFQATLTVRLGNKLAVELAVTNSGTEKFSYTDALHSYIKVGSISQICIEGLEGATYLDGLNQGATNIQPMKYLEVNKEENRRYLNTKDDCIVHDPVLKRKIRVEKRRSNTTVVWNPWIETARNMADMGDDDYKTMICVEATNAFNDVITVLPGQTYCMATLLSSNR